MRMIGSGLTAVGLMTAVGQAMAADYAMATGQAATKDVKRTTAGTGYDSVNQASNGHDTGGAGGIIRQPRASTALNAESATSDAGRTALAASPQHRPVDAIFGAG